MVETAAGPLRSAGGARSTRSIWQLSPRHSIDWAAYLRGSSFVFTDLWIAYSISLDRAGSGSGWFTNSRIFVDHPPDAEGAAALGGSSARLSMELSSATGTGGMREAGSVFCVGLAEFAREYEPLFSRNRFPDSTHQMPLPSNTSRMDAIV